MWQIGTQLINEIEHFYVYRIHKLGFVQYADDNLYCYDIAKSIADELNKEELTTGRRNHNVS